MELYAVRTMVIYLLKGIPQQYLLITLLIIMVGLYTQNKAKYHLKNILIQNLVIILLMIMVEL